MGVKILVIQQKMIGDVLTSTILLKPLKNKYPNAKIHYAINSHTLAVAQENPFVDKFILITPTVDANKWTLFKFLKQIKTEKYDIVIDVYGKISSLLMVLFSGAKIKIGYEKQYTKWIYSHPVERQKKALHNATLAIENRMRLLEPLNISYTAIVPKIYLKKTELEHAKQLLKKGNLDLNKPLFMISVLGSGIQKTYPFKYMAQLLDNVIKVIPNAQLLFNYIPSQKEEAQQIYNSCQLKTREQIFFDVFGKSLREFLAITNYCNAMIGNEGGAVNMAKALKKPSFIVFSPQINKSSWFNESEKKHTAVHLSDYMDHGKEERAKARKDSRPYYEKLTPYLIQSKLEQFLKTI